MTVDDLTVGLVLAAALAVFVGMFVQSAAGFGGGLAALPILLWAGWPAPEAICVVVAAAVAQLVTGVYRYRSDVPWKPVAHVSAYRLAAIVPGIFVLDYLEDRGPIVKQAIGAAVIAAALARAAIRVQPRPRLPAWATGVTGVISGFMASAVGIGGPPLVLWAAAHQWSTRAIRSALWSAFLISIPPLAALMLWRFGDRVIPGWIVGAALTPVSLAGMSLGMVAVRHASPDRLRAGMLALLVILGLSTFLQPWILGK
ncbi:MAG: TSUP family transporter [Planctomycetota bacterium]